MLTSIFLSDSVAVYVGCRGLTHVVGEQGFSGSRASGCEAENMHTQMRTQTVASAEFGQECFEREASEANTLSGSDEHVIQGEDGIICSFIWFIPLDVSCSAAAAVTLQEMKVFTELGHPFAQLQDAPLRRAGPLM